jgi:serine/threonine protein phosphatase 1
VDIGICPDGQESSPRERKKTGWFHFLIAALKIQTTSLAFIIRFHHISLDYLCKAFYKIAGVNIREIGRSALPMSIEKTFVVGDIHGCLGVLKRLIDKIPWDPSKDRLIFIGDYIDRGEDSRGVIEYVVTLTKNSQKVQCLIGNHEQALFDYLSGNDTQTYILNGGGATLISYDRVRRNKDDPLIPPEHLDFFSSLLPMVELDDYYIVHAGFRPHIPIENQELSDMLWIRNEFLLSEYDFGKVVIFGHTPFNNPVVMKNKIGIDTGAVYGNRLTCLELPEIRFHSVAS